MAYVDSTATVTPLTFLCRAPGTYSVILKVGSVRTTALSGFQIPKGDVETAIANADSFSFAIQDLEDVLEVYIMGAQSQVVMTGAVPLLHDFVTLEPSQDSPDTVYEPLELK